MKNETSRKVGTTEVTISADWAQAGSAIMVRYADCGDPDAEWETSGKQVADFRHDENAAIDYFCNKL